MSVQHPFRQKPFCHVTGKAEMAFRGKLQHDMNTHTKNAFFSCSFGQKHTQRFTLHMNYTPHLHELKVFFMDVSNIEKRYN